MIKNFGKVLLLISLHMYAMDKYKTSEIRSLDFEQLSLDDEQRKMTFEDMIQCAKKGYPSKLLLEYIAHGGDVTVECPNKSNFLHYLCLEAPTYQSYVEQLELSNKACYILRVARGLLTKNNLRGKSPLDMCNQMIQLQKNTKTQQAPNQGLLDLFCAYRD